MILPEEFEKEMKELLGDQYEAYRESLSLPVRQGCRVNTWKVEKEKWNEICPFAKEQIPWIENGYFLSEDSGASRHPYYFAGLYYFIARSEFKTASKATPTSAKTASHRLQRDKVAKIKIRIFVPC